MKKVMSTVFAVGLALSVFSVPAFAAGYEDGDAHWAKDSINRWSDAGVVSGYPDGLFYPEEGMTRAEAASAFAELLDLQATADISKFTDVAADAWYKDAISKCVAADIMVGVDEDSMDPEGTLTREQMMVMLCKAFNVAPEASLDEGKSFSDYDQTSAWAASYINALINAGYVSGNNDGTLEPADDMLRGELMALLDKTIAIYANESGEYDASGSGIILVVADNVVLKNAPAGTVVVTAPGAEGTAVNGDAVASDTIIEVGTGEGTTGEGTTGEGTTGGSTTGGSTTGGSTTGGSTTGGSTTGGSTTGGSTTGGSTTGGSTTGNTTTGAVETN